MRRFFVQEDLRSGESLRLSREETKHAAKVLRLEPGARVLVLNGRGLEADATLMAIGPEGADLRIDEVRKIEKAVRLELLQATLKGPKMDWLVEKLTELGVDALWPLRSERTVATGEKEDRWVRIAQAAMKQSGNPTLPKILKMDSLAQQLSQIPTSYRILLQPGASCSLFRSVQNALGQGAKTILLAIGPEGGFTAEEEQQLIAAGFHAANLSKQVLRGETASVAALAIASHCIDFQAAEGL